MHRIFRTIATIVALGAIIVAPVASAGQSPAAMTASTGEAHAIPVILESGFSNMKVEELAAVAVGAAVVGGIANMYFDSGLFTILGVTIGAALGSYWYEGEMPEFSLDELKKLYNKYFD